jgi:hypothetical protein
MSELQSILCPKTYSLTKFKTWLLNHNYLPIKKIHSTTNYYRARMENPITNAEYYSIILPNGIIFVFQKNI